MKSKDDQVDAALRELRTMFPTQQLIISVRDCGEETRTARGKSIEWGIQVGINGKDFSADTLPEAMKAVRRGKDKLK